MKSYSVFSLIYAASAAVPEKGSYTPAREIDHYNIENVGGDSGKMHVYYPKNAKAGEKFPLVSYAHGLAGGSVDLLGYTRLFNDIASFGFVVVAPNTCNLKCNDPVKSPWADCNPDAVQGKNPDADGWNTWFGEQIRAIDYAKNHDDAIFNLIDWDAGVAIAGHSMGGQATAWSAHENCTSLWNIKTAAIHHGVWGTTNDKIGVPVAGFGSTGDEEISMKTKQVVDQSPVYPKIWRNAVGSSHLEPLLEPPVYNTLLAPYTAAWFKYTLGLDADNHWHDLIFDQSNPDSLCNSQKMQNCTLMEHAPSFSV